MLFDDFTVRWRAGRQRQHTACQEFTDLSAAPVRALRRCVGRCSQRLRRLLPLVAMVDATDAREGDDLGVARRPLLDWPRFRGVLVQREMTAVDLMVRHILANKPSSMAFIENDYMI